MAVWGKDRHYHWKKIRPDHFVATAESLGVPNAAQLFADLFKSVVDGCDRVESELPKGFPAEIAEPILEGVRTKATDALSAL